MSNPLANLKKTQKNNFLPGNRPMPFRNPYYSEDESKLLEEITGGMASSRVKSQDPFVSGLPKIKKSNLSHSQGFGVSPRTVAAPTDHDLMSTMMTRITQLEAKLAYQNKDMAEKDKKILVLEEKVKLLQKVQERDVPSHVTELENKCHSLQQQIQDMETFLADYGMVWVGEKADDESEVYNDDSEEDVWRPASSVSQQPSYQINYNTMIENIKDLNALAGEGVAKITHTKDGARLKMPDAVQLTLYANGILLFNGPFRPFVETSTQNFVQDILDGYFPSELQQRYPEGVPFNVTDKREVVYEDKRSDLFRGTGQTLGGEIKPSRLVPTNIDIATDKKNDDTRERTCEKPGPQLTVEQFLSKLPTSVVKAGKVLDIRSSLGETLQGGPRGKGDVTLIETDTVIQLKKRLEGTHTDRPYTPRDTTTLRIKSEDGNHTYILKMKFSDTVGDLRRYLSQHRGSNASDFDIVSTHPVKIHSDETMTLHSAGLTPNAVAHLKIRKTL